MTASALEWSPGAAGPVLKLVPDPAPEREQRTPRGTLNRLVWPDARELAWQDLALCAETDPEAFFPEKGGSTREAKRVCRACDVRPECLAYALDHDERFGIWGGLSERERRRLKRKAVQP